MQRGYSHTRAPYRLGIRRKKNGPPLRHLPLRTTGLEGYKALVSLQERRAEDKGHRLWRRWFDLGRVETADKAVVQILAVEREMVQVGEPLPLEEDRIQKLKATIPESLAPHVQQLELSRKAMNQSLKAANQPTLPSLTFQEYADVIPGIDTGTAYTAGNKKSGGGQNSQSNQKSGGGGNGGGAGPRKAGPGEKWVQKKQQSSSSGGGSSSGAGAPGGGTSSGFTK
ncbi:unnamed protein product [Vitrella brassicaformis CCMP3155]|uniref:Uncharacterized protein n=1 Tax=Vitrella brassicaformis (strain CCMP3155) TaxID=1169540 RepID=A0A0G4GXD5_VITBC|nr:unnamed protein product [Vitrella brassicaformis CCMP3155]|eukprot:CEM35704.1 unnamed protein product [Vitrella brassicaformis CCMP3155]